MQIPDSVVPKTSADWQVREFDTPLYDEEEWVEKFDDELGPIYIDDEQYESTKGNIFIDFGHTQVNQNDTQTFIEHEFMVEVEGGKTINMFGPYVAVAADGKYKIMSDYEELKKDQLVTLKEWWEVVLNNIHSEFPPVGDVE
jgi:hypothetical protein